MKTIYECDKCGMRFDKFDDCHDHERNHVYAIRTEELDYNRDELLEGGPYPLHVKLKMTDGAEVVYGFVAIHKQPRADDDTAADENEVA